ncbi:GDP-mannose transporter [Quaeritorhiza haematococci]|nr:GDP-mannose transporter [Quaeritorhiza haematococci]
MIYTGSKTLQYMSIPLYTIFKNLTIILIAYGELAWFNGSPVTPIMLMSFMFMVSSSVIAGWSDLSSGKVLKADAQRVGPLVSYGWMIANCLTTAFYALMMRFKIRDVGFKDFDTVFYNNLLSVPVLLVLSIFNEVGEFQKTKEKYFGSGMGMGMENEEVAAKSAEFSGLMWAVVISSVSSFAISYGSSWCVRVTSSTTYR